jgi:AcrR family transcriptional regulator
MRFAKPGRSKYKPDFFLSFHASTRGAGIAGFYLHIEPGNVYAGGGSFTPDPASLEKIRTRMSAAAHPGKTTLYGRFPTKADLFAAFVRRSGAGLSPFVVGHSDGTPRERLAQAGIALADLMLTVDSIALMKVTSAESETFPELAREGFRLGFGDCAGSIAECLAHITSLDIVVKATPMGERFVELALHPLYMHAFFGADLDMLRKRARHDVPFIADYFFDALVTSR